MQGTDQPGEDSTVTYYYTYFECFEERSFELLFSYHSFIEKLIIHLGEDWRIESNLLWDEYYKDQDPENCSDIFNVFLQVFLVGKLNCESNAEHKSENTLLEEYHERVVKEFVRPLEGVNPKEVGETLTFKTLSVGFFVTAIEIWDAACATVKEAPRGKDFISKVELKPLAISIESKFQEPSARKLRRFSGSNFTQAARAGLQGLDLHSYASAEVDENTEQEIDTKKRQREKHIVWRKFEAKEQLPQSMLTRIKSSLTTMTKCETKQLISTFVANILQVTFERSGRRQNVRIIRICREFYHAVVLIWLFFNAKKNYAMTFKEYESYVRYILEEQWKATFTVALKQIYNVLVTAWNHIVKEHTIDLNEDYEVMKIFFVRVRSSLLDLWQSKIINIDPAVFV